MCQEHSPAVLICDDVDSLVPPNVEGASPQDIAYYQRYFCSVRQVQSYRMFVNVCVLCFIVKSEVKDHLICPFL